MGKRRKSRLTSRSNQVDGHATNQNRESTFGHDEFEEPMTIKVERSGLQIDISLALGRSSVWHTIVGIVSI